METELLTQLITAIVALIMAVLAVYKNREAATAKANTTAVLSAYTPGSMASQQPEIVSQLPERSWKMSESTKRWLTFDATPDNKSVILQQIEEAESAHLTGYQIHFDGGYYVIEYGLLKGGAGNPSGK